MLMLSCSGYNVFYDSLGDIYEDTESGSLLPSSIRRRDSSFVPPASPIAPDRPISTNSSDVSSTTDEASRYLTTIRLYDCIDAVGLLLRAIFPCPLWFAYLDSDTHLFSLLYGIFKGFTILERSRDILEIVLLLMRHSLVCCLFCCFHDLDGAKGVRPLQYTRRNQRKQSRSMPNML